MYEEGPAGFNYLPQFAILYSPFSAFSLPTQAIAWRAFSVACYLSALLALGRLASQSPLRPAFLGVLLLVALPPAVSSLQSGQANMILAAAMAWGAVSLGKQRWNLAAILLVTAVMIKPLAIVLLLLAAVGYRTLIPRVGLGLAFALALPFLLAPPAYAWATYGDCVQNLRVAMPASGRIFSDFFGIFRVLGIFPSSQVMMGTRLATGAATLALWLLVSRRFSEPRRVELLHGLATIYLMLFNPMNEMNSYVILAPAVALMAARSWESARPLAWTLTFIAVSFGSDNYGPANYHATKNWLPPLATLLLVGLVMQQILRSDSFAKSEGIPEWKRRIAA